MRVLSRSENVVAGVQGSRDRGADVLPLAQGVWRVEGGPGSTPQGTGAGEREAEASGLGVEPGEARVVCSTTHKAKGARMVLL